MKDFKGKVAVITGAANGIGRGIADQVFEAIKEERFYILTHPEWLPVIQMRVDNLLRAENPQSPTETLMKILKPTG
jgi:hypothetical protein